MDSDISSALSLLIVGMITVFVVLLLVVITGNLLIRLVNKVTKENNDNTPSAAKIAAITATVDIITKWQGKVQKIEKQ